MLSYLSFAWLPDSLFLQPQSSCRALLAVHIGLGGALKQPLIPAQGRGICHGISHCRADLFCHQAAGLESSSSSEVS